MTDATNSDNLVELAADVVAAYVSNNTVAMAEIPSLIAQVHRALVATATGSVEKPVEAQTPAVSIKKSIHPDYIICLEDGKKLKMLKRHLMTSFNLTPDQYRQRWGLPADYPMVAPNYAARRRELAVKIGLGRKRAA